MTTPNTPMTELDPPLEYDLWSIKEWALLHLGPQHSVTMAATRAHNEILAQMADLANLRYKQSGGPAKDNQDRAVKLEQQWSEAARLGGMLS